MKSTDLSTTYLRKMGMTREYVNQAEEKIPISGQGYTNGKLLDQTEYSILIHMCKQIIHIKILLYEM